MSTSDVFSCAVATYGTAYLTGARPSFDHLVAMANSVSFDDPVWFDGGVHRLGEAFDELAGLGVRRVWLTDTGDAVAPAVAEPTAGRWLGTFETPDDGGRGYAARESYAWEELPGFTPERPSLDAAAERLRAALAAAGADVVPGSEPPMYGTVVPDGWPTAARDVAWAAVWALDVASRLGREHPARGALLDAMRGGLVAAANA
jgi:hypothetical protein